MGRQPSDGEDRRRFLKRAGAVAGATVWAVPTMQVVRMASASAQISGSVVLPGAPSTTATSAGVATLYADGSIECPDHWADDTSTPVGQVTFRSTEYGIRFDIVLTAAAPNWDYEVAINQQAGDCINKSQYFSGPATDENGDGSYGATYIAGPGSYAIQANVASANGVPPNPKHREIGQNGFVSIRVF